MSEPKETFLALLYPDGITCIVCGGELDRDTKYGVCERCALPYNTSFCPVCGRHSKLGGYCDRCKGKRDFSFDIARAPFVFGDGIEGVVHALKYGNARWLPKYLAQFMADSYFECGQNADILTFVPLHRKREKKRGYNQAALLSAQLAPLIEKEPLPILTRIKDTKNLARMKRDARLKEIEGAFELLPEADVADKNILLIDDVLTAGATAGECARVLKGGGAKSVFVLTLATSVIRPVLQ
ncbi:MAG: ComF family protein [Clostridiales bacterium]|nr:ComF family protein [Clostridiales bacterium]